MALTSHGDLFVSGTPDLRPREKRRIRVGVESNEGRGGLAPAQSLRHTSAALAEGLGRLFEVCAYPPGFGRSTPDQRRESAERLVTECDVIVGSPDESLLEARTRLDNNVCFVFLLPGAMSRGGAYVSRVLRYMRTRDVFVVNSCADADTARKYLDNARIRILPWPVSDAVFHPVGRDALAAARQTFGFAAEDRVVLYAGRLSLEKNVHSVIRVFSVVHNMIPEARLVLAGEAPNVPFFELGVHPLTASTTLGRIVARLGLQEVVRYLGPLGQEELAALYNVADVAINLTLHHSENFGLSQIEALLCGTPVVGSHWGGLKDTVVENGTGYPVSTVVTEHGVKVNWWEAAARTVTLLREDRDEARRQSCVRFGQRFSQAAHDAIIGSIVREGIEARESSWEPVRPTRFASEYWSECLPRQDAPPPYQRSPRAFALYRELVASYAGLSDLGIALDTPFADSQIIALATPVQLCGDGVLSINDPIFPFDVTLADEHRSLALPIIQMMVDQPVMTFERLRDTCAEAGLCWNEDTVRCLLRAGVLLRSKSSGVQPHGDAARSMSVPLYCIRHVDYDVDVVVKR